MFSRRSIVGYAGALLSGIFVSKSSATTEKTHNEKTLEEMVEYVKEKHNARSYLRISRKVKPDDYIIERDATKIVDNLVVRYSYGTIGTRVCLDNISYAIDLLDIDLKSIIITSDDPQKYPENFSTELWIRERYNWVQSPTTKELKEKAQKLLPKKRYW